MTKIAVMAGTHKRRFDVGDVTTLSDGKLDLLIALERQEIERDRTAELRGIGSTKVDGYTRRIAVLKDALYAVEKAETESNSEEDLQENTIQNLKAVDQMVADGVYKKGNSINGIGAVQYRRNKIEGWRPFKNLKDKFNSTKAGQFLQNVGDKIKDGVKTAVRFGGKLISLPARMAIKGIMEVALPRAAPNFLYIFIPDSKASKMTSKGRQRRAKALNVQRFIVDKIGMKEHHFKGIIKNGIIKRLGQTPESILRPQGLFGIAGGAAAAISNMPPEEKKMILNTIVKVLREIGNIFRKKPVDYNPDDAPNPEDDFVHGEDYTPEDYGDDTSGGGTNGSTKNGGKSSGWC